MKYDENSDIEHIKIAVKKAVCRLYEREGEIISRLREPAIVSRLMGYLSNIIENQYVECIYVDNEYDRDFNTKKMIYESCKKCELAMCEAFGSKICSCRPDILIHARQDYSKDICAIEVKKMSNTINSERKKDKKKLSYLTCNKGKYEFQLGMFIDIGEERCEWTLYSNAVNVEHDIIYQG